MSWQSFRRCAPQARLALQGHLEQEQEREREREREREQEGYLTLAAQDRRGQ